MECAARSLVDWHNKSILHDLPIGTVVEGVYIEMTRERYCVCGLYLQTPLVTLLVQGLRGAEEDSSSPYPTGTAGPLLEVSGFALALWFDTALGCKVPGRWSTTTDGGSAWLECGGGVGGERCAAS